MSSLDTTVPALLVKIGHYPAHAGGLAAVRTLGRLGVPVHVLTEDPFTPLAVSRYRAGRFGWRTTGLEDPPDLVARLSAIGRRIGTRSVAIATDDEAAILLAEHAAELAEHFIIPAVPPDLPRQLASKDQLFLLCQQHDVPAPLTAVLTSPAEVLDHAERAEFPLVVKNGAPWMRLSTPVVPNTGVIHSAAELRELGDGRYPRFSLLAQQYIPPAHAQDWIVSMYCDASSDAVVLFTGVKVRAWPPHVGVGTSMDAIFNPELAELAGRFCKAVGYQGAADLDFRLDLRDGRYKLVDFNPRVGSNFALFKSADGLDVVRALHLDLTDRKVLATEQVDGHRLVVEHQDLAARLAYRSVKPALPPGPGRRSIKTALAFASWRDPLPFLVLWPSQVKPLLRYLRRLQGHRRWPQWRR